MANFINSICSNGQTVVVESNGGAINIATDSSDTSVTIGTGTGVSKITLHVGSGGLNLPAFTTTGALVSDASGSITDATAGTSGFVLTSNGAGSVPTFQANAGGGGFTWNNTTTATQAMAVGNGYMSNDGATLVTFTLPATATVGQMVAIQGSGSGLWTLVQNTGQTIHFNAVSTTTTTGSVSSTGQYDSLTLLCNIANTDWVVYQATGNLSVV